MLRFTIRDLFWLTLVVASLIGWWVDLGEWEEELLKRLEYQERRAANAVELVKAQSDLVTLRLLMGIGQPATPALSDQERKAGYAEALHSLVQEIQDDPEPSPSETP